MRALAVGLLLALVVAGQAGSAGLRPAELLYLDDSSPPAVVAISADGTQRRVVVTTGSTDDPKALAVARDGRLAWGGTGGLVTSAADGSGQVRLAKTFAMPLAWSPNGRWLAYATLNGLWVSHADGSGAHVVATRGFTASWSPDSRRLVVSGPYDGNGIRIVRIDGHFVRWLQRCGRGASWSPTGRWIAFEPCDDAVTAGIRLIRPDGTAGHYLTRPKAGSDSGAAWSPDGARVAFSHSAPAADDAPAKIYVVSLAGRNLGNMDSYLANADDEPVWSPDGRQLAFMRYAALEPIASPVRLMVAAVRTGHVRVIGTALGSPASWRPR